MTSKPLTSEETRILKAAGEGRLYKSDTHRWQISNGSPMWLDGNEPPPNPQARVRLFRRGLIEHPVSMRGRDYAKLTATGKGWTLLEPGDANAVG